MLKVAILGCGFMGTAHAASYNTLQDRVTLHTVWSRSHERAARLAREVGAKAVADLLAAATDPDVDVVDICLPTHLHREAAEAALAQGKHVLLEKPIALTHEDADAIILAAEKSPSIFMVGLTLRFWPEYVELQRRMAARELGQPLVVSTQRLSPPADWNDWMARPELSGGVAVDLLIHDFDQMNWLLGKPRTVFARELTAGHVIATVDYGGAYGTAEGGMRMPTSYPFSSKIRVLCDAGVAEYSFEAAAAANGGNIGEIDTTAPGLRLYSSGGMVETATAPPATDPWQPEILYFIECVEQNRTPERGTGEQARQALSVSIAANRSIRSGRLEPV